MYSCTLKGSMTFSSFSARYFEKGEISKTPHLKKNVSITKLIGGRQIGQKWS